MVCELVTILINNDLAQTEYQFNSVTHRFEYQTLMLYV